MLMIPNTGRGCRFSELGQVKANRQTLLLTGGDNGRAR